MLSKCIQKEVSYMRHKDSKTVIGIILILISLITIISCIIISICYQIDHPYIGVSNRLSEFPQPIIVEYIAVLIFYLGVGIILYKK